MGRDVPDDEDGSKGLAIRSDNAAAREYALGVVKGLIGAIPYVGGLLNEVVFEARSRIKQQRIEALFADVASSVSKLSENQIDREYMRSEEFSDLVEEIIVRTARTHSASKRDCFRRILVSGLSGVRSPDFSSLFLAILEEMSDAELRVCGIYYAMFHALRERRRSGSTTVEIQPIDYTADEIHGLEPMLFKQVVQSLIRKGLLFDDSHGRWGGKAFTVVEPTELGAHFYEWISREVDSRDSNL